MNLKLARNCAWAFSFYVVLVFSGCRSKNYQQPDQPGIRVIGYGVHKKFYARAGDSLYLCDILKQIGPLPAGVDHVRIPWPVTTEVDHVSVKAMGIIFIPIGLATNAIDGRLPIVAPGTVVLSRVLPSD